MLLIRDVPAHAVLGTIALSYPLLGIVPYDDLWTAVSSPPILAIILLLLLTPVLMRGIGIATARKLLVHKGEVQLTRLLPVTLLSSAFISNTAIVAIITNIISGKHKLAHRWLLPISYISIIGGTFTIVGTSTNLVVIGLLEELRYEPFGFFDLAPVAAVVTVLTVPILLWQAKRVLVRTDLQESSETDLWHIEAAVPAGSNLIGQSLESAGMRHLQSHFVSGIRRAGRSVMAPSPEFIIAENDVLYLQGDLEQFVELLHRAGISLGNPKKKKLTGSIVHALVPKLSPLVGTTLKKADFRAKVDAVVVALQRNEDQIVSRLANQQIEAGDVIALLCGPNFQARSEELNWFRVIGGNSVSPAQTIWPWYAFAGVLVLAATQQLHLAAGLLIFMAVLGWTGHISIEHIRRNMPYELWGTLVAALVIADGFANSGLAHSIVEFMVGTVASSSATVWLGIVLILCMALTTVITNVAATALMLPIAVQIATSIDVNYLPFAVACAFGCSASFLLPHSYQTNLIVATPGAYKTTDFLKIGVPVTVTYLIAAGWAIPKVFPF